MNLIRPSASIKWLLFGIAVLPALFYVYLGHHSRMMLDDYAFLSRGSELGPIQSMVYWRSIWMSSYSNPFLHGLLGSLGAVVPPLFPAIIVAVWTFGLSWLIRPPRSQ